MCLFVLGSIVVNALILLCCRFETLENITRRERRPVPRVAKKKKNGIINHKQISKSIRKFSSKKINI